MNKSILILTTLLLFGCSDIRPTEPPSTPGIIVVSVHWQNSGIAGIPVVLVQTGDSLQTGSNGLAVYSVPGGHYVVRAYGINRGGPVALSIDYDVNVTPGGVAIIDIVDCLPCV